MNNRDGGEIIDLLFQTVKFDGAANRISRATAKLTLVVDGRTLCAQINFRRRHA